MPSDRVDTKASADLGAYWRDQDPAAEYRILPSGGQRLRVILLILVFTLFALCGLLFGFGGYTML